MSNQDEDSRHITYHNILELYQRCKENGDWAKVYLETRGGNQFFTISVNVSAGSTTGTSSGMETKKKKKPGQVRRDKQRRTAFMERRRQAAAVAEEARIDKIREEQVEKSGDVETGAGETSSGVGVETGQASAVRSGGNQNTAQSVDDTSSATSDDLQAKADGEDIMQIDGNISLCEIEAVEKEKEKPVVENCWKTWGEETVMCWTNGPLPSNGDLDFVWRKPKCYAIDIGKVAENKLKVTLLMGEGYTWDNHLWKKENWPKGCVKLERVL